MTPVAYPAEQSVDAALRDGSTVHVRPVLDTDEDAIRAFLESMSLQVELQTSLSEETREARPMVITEAPIRVVLAVDHAALRRSLRLVLELEPDLAVVEEAPGWVAALLAVVCERPHVLVLDLRSHRGSSIETVRRLRSQVPATEIVVLTMAASAAFAREVTAAGALGYVLKDLADSELPVAIRAAARHEPYVSRVLAQRI